MRVSLRVLFIVVTLLASVIAIAANRYRVRHAALAIIARDDAVVEFKEDDRPLILPVELSRAVRRLEFRGTRLDEETLWAIAQLNEVSEISVINSNVGVRECKTLSQLSSLTVVSFFGTHIEDGAIAELVKCPNMTSLCLSFSSATDADCGRLADCKSLSRIELNGTAVTDAGLISIARLPCLSVVCISEGPISQQGIGELLSRRALTALHCFGDDFRDEWWAGIRERYPKCRIHR